MPEKQNDSNRRRKWAPKARTGCRTCKTRHVKCDETKPVCRRCVLSGFRCDGYPATSQSSSAKQESATDSSSNEKSSDGNSTSPSESSVASIRIKTEPNGQHETSIALKPLMICPSQPYNDSEGQSLQYFIGVTSAMVSRSTIGPQFWQDLVPKAAATYPSVRHAMIAAALSSRALIEKSSNDPSLRSASDLQILTHTSLAVKSLLSEKIPLDVVLLTSATLGILDLFEGRWDTAVTHVTSGANMAKSVLSGHTRQNFIAWYCDAFASMLPTVLKREADTADNCPPEKNSVVRLDEAVRSLRLAQNEFEQAIAKVQTHSIPDGEAILTSLSNAKMETEWILSKWERLLGSELERTSPPDDYLSINLHRVESPWSAIMEELNSYLDYGALFDLAKFEITMERTLPFFMLAKSGPNVKMRETAAELMFYSAKLRRQGERPPRQPLQIRDRITEADSEAG